MKYIYILIAAMFLFACKGSKKISKTPVGFDLTTKEGVLNAIASQELMVESLEAKLKTNFENKERSVNFKTTIKMQKDEQIWISASVFGFEGAQALITPDSVKIINRLERTYAEEPIDKIKDITGLPVTFETFQDLLLANILYTDATATQYQNKDNTIELITELGQLVNVALIDESTLQLARQTMLDSGSGQQMEIDYHNYQPVKNKWFPMEQSIHVTGDDEIWVDLEFTAIEVNTNPTIRFNLNKNYKRERY